MLEFVICEKFIEIELYNVDIDLINFNIIH